MTVGPRCRLVIRSLAIGLLASLLLAVAGCGGASSKSLVKRGDVSRFGMAGVDHVTDTAWGARDDFIRLTDEPDDPDPLYVFDGITGEPLTGREALIRMRAADVLILGETHVDPVAHRLQRRIVRDVLAGGSGALTLEMLTRADQPILDRLYRRRLDSNTSVKASRYGAIEGVLEKTSLESWNRWRSFYAPIINSALAQGRPVIGANAPREFVSTARTDGYDALRRLPKAQQRLFDLPEEERDFPQYRERFMRQMTGHAPAHPQARPDDPTVPAPRPTTLGTRERIDAHVQPSTRPATRPTTRPATMSTSHSTASPESFYRSQLVWDATMAQSILQARRRHGAPVVHLVGTFHSDFNGGLTQMVSSPRRTVVTVTFLPLESQRLRPEDVGRADMVIYTGPERPLPPEPEPATRRARDRVMGRTPAVAGQGPAAPATVPATRPGSTRPTTQPAERRNRGSRR